MIETLTHKAGLRPRPTARPLPGNALVTMRRTAVVVALVPILVIFPISYVHAASPPEAPASAPSPYSYADIADLAAPANAIVVIVPRSLVPVEKNAIPGPEAIRTFYVQADVKALIRGQDAVPPRISFLLQLPTTKTATKALKGRMAIIFGRAADRPGEFQLLSGHAILPWSAATDTKVRAITSELVASDAPPQISRVVEAFHVAGTVAGEGETQVFLTTTTGRPISLSIVRRPDEQPKFGAAMGEVVDEAAALPKPDTLLWYRLACALPSVMPSEALAKLEATDADAAQRDYRAFMEALGPCIRTLGNAAAGPSAP